MLCEAAIVLPTDVCVSLCLFAQKLKNYWWEVDVTCCALQLLWTKFIRYWWHLTLTFNLQSSFSIVSRHPCVRDQLHMQQILWGWVHIFQVLGSVWFVKTVAVERQRHKNRGAKGRGVFPSSPGRSLGRGHRHRKFLIFHFKILHSGALSCTNFKVYMLSNAGKGTFSRYSWQFIIIIMIINEFHRDASLEQNFRVNAIDGDTDMKTSSFHQSWNLSPSSQSVATRVSFTATVGMCCRPKIILYMSCKRKLHCRLL